MDTSKEYIKMCDKALEIQALKREEKHKGTGKWIAGDFWTTVFHSDKYRIFVVGDQIECIWLPRQDQLQDMITIAQSPSELVDLLLLFLEFAGPNYSKLFSMEQLWLAFVMKENSNKVWDGSDWKIHN